MTKVNQH